MAWQARALCTLFNVNDEIHLFELGAKQQQKHAGIFLSLDALVGKHQPWILFFMIVNVFHERRSWLVPQR